jgi:hypothetical protein
MAEINLAGYLAEARKRDLWTEFQVWYEAKHQEDPESYPLDLQPSEWDETFKDFLSTLCEGSV